MQCVYHRRAGDFRGEIIYPLYKLRAVDEGLFHREASKYEGRRAVMDQAIAGLDIAWNDAVHCSPVHPHRIFHALQAAGCQPSDALEWFVLPLDRLESTRTVIYRYPEKSRDSCPWPPEDFAVFDASSFRELTNVPRSTLEYFARCADDGIAPLMFHRIPHVLVGHAIDAAGLATVRWNDPIADAGAIPGRPGSS